MAKIRDSRPKISSGGYLRLVQHEQLATLLTKAHSTNVRNGKELERIIFNKVPLKNCINDLNEFINNCKSGKTACGTYLCSSEILASSRFKMNKHQPDLLAFTIGQYNSCCIIELKDGDDFDTKKSQSKKIR